MLVLLAGLVLAAPYATPHAHAAELAIPLSRDALFTAYLHYFEPLAIASRGGDAPMCATALVETLKLRWDEFTPIEQARMTAQIAPFLPDLRAGLMPRSQPVGGQAPPPPGDDACWGPYLENTLHGDHFSVEWQDGTISDAEAADLLDELEHAYDVQVTDIGWREPAGMDRYLLPVYVVAGGYASAYTTLNTESCGGEYLPYIVAYEGSFSFGDWWMDMAAHEFNHASQFAYGAGMEFWFWEATATYMQEHVYPAHNEWSPYITGYSDQPYLSMSASNQQDTDIFWHMYGMAIWNFWIDENHGGVDTILDLWDYASNESEYYSVSQQDALDGIGLDFAEVFKGFTAANTVMDYREQHSFPGMRAQVEVDDLPADGSSTSSTAPEAFGSNYIWFDLVAPTQDKKDLLFTFTGDEPANWLIQLVGANDDGVEMVVEVELTESTGVGRLADYGSYEQVWAVVSPRKEDTGTFSYSWTAEGAIPLVAETGTEDDGTGTGTGTASDPEIEGESSGIFGCDATGGPVRFAGLGALLALLATRRRA